VDIVTGSLTESLVSGAIGPLEARAVELMEWE
jgi:hypothetical protein